MAYWRGRPQTKFGNRVTLLDGHRFASQKEARRYAELCLLLKAGEIRDLVLQPRYAFVVNGVKVCSYVADFAFTRKDGTSVVEDVKSTATKTPLYRVKRQLMRACYGIDIQEV
jgi:hypothetical protein